MRPFGRIASLFIFFCLAGCGSRSPAPPPSAAPAAWDESAIESAQARLDAVAQAVVQSDASGRLGDVLAARTSLQSAVAELRQQRGDLPPEVADRADRLAKAIDRREADITRRALGLHPPAEGDAGVASETPPAPPPEEVVLRWPLPVVEITSTFGHRMGVMGFDGDEMKFHDGVDLRVKEGDPVRACGPGTIAWAGIRGGYGLLVAIDHGLGVQTWYAHLSATDALVGQRVAAGDVIGRAGTSGRSTAPHLHLMVTVAGRKLDPVDAIGVPLGELAGARAAGP